VEDSTDDSSNALYSEGSARRKLGVLTEFKITSESKSLSARVVSVEGEVKVGLRVTGNDGSSKHLSELLDVGFESSHGVDDADEGEHEEREDQSDDESPPRKLRVAGVASSHGASERSNHDSTVDPHGNFLVNSHELVVRIGLSSSSVRLESLEDRSPVPDPT